MSKEKDTEDNVDLITGQELARQGEVLPAVIHLLPVTSRPFFPGQAVPLLMEMEHWTSTMKAVKASEHGIIGIVLAKAKTWKLRNPQISTA